MKKFSIMLTALLLVVITLSGSIYAKDAQLSEKQLNAILLESGVPQDVLDSYDLNTKQTIVKNSGTNLKFVGYNKKSFQRTETGELQEVTPDTDIGNITTLGAISRTDLIFWITIFTNVSDSSAKDVYGSFEWLDTGNGPSSGPAGIQKDMFSITVPDGWQIQSGSYGAQLSYRMYDIILGHYPSSWTNMGTTGIENSGQPASDGYSMYGAAWRYNSSAGNGLSIYKGLTYLTMKKVDSDAINRVIVYYMEAKNSALGTFGVSLAWKALSVSFTPTAGSNNVANADTSW